MTRKSRREIEQSVEDLAGENSGMVREWLERYVVESVSNAGVELNCGPPGGTGRTPGTVPVGEVVAYLDADGRKYTVPVEDIPAWIDAGEDLPLRGGPDESNPFVVADFTGAST